jgi:hypothetical protein
MNQVDYLSFLDIANRLFPLKRHLAEPISLAVSFSAIWILVVFASGEQRHIFGDYATPALIAMIAFFDYMEPYIGDRIRGISLEAFEKIGVRRDELLRRIFDKKIRGAVGIFAAVDWSITFILVFEEHLWYSSPLPIAFQFVLGCVGTFIMGEAVAGALIIVFKVYKIGSNIERIDIFDMKQMSTLRSLGNWCLLIAGTGGGISALAFPALFFAPWRGETLWISSWGKVYLLAEIPILIALFVFPLTSLHRVLVKSKAEHLENLYKGYKRVHERFMPVVRDKSVEEMIAEAAVLSDVFTNINVVLNLINETPDWPWDTSVLQTLVATLVASVVSYAIFQVI